MEWQLLDDFIFHERQFVQLAGVASAFFHLAAGTAQGRKFRVHVFNAMLRWLSEACDAVGLSARALLPLFARDALDASHVLAPVTLRVAPPAREPGRVKAAVDAIVAAAAADSEPWRLARQQAIHQLAGLQSLTDRIDVIERLGEFAMVLFQYVDDGVAPTPCLAAARAMIELGFRGYAAKVKADFNPGPTKTAICVAFDAPVGDDVVSTYRSLGITVDSQFTFQPRLMEVLRAGRYLFK